MIPDLTAKFDQISLSEPIKPFTSNYEDSKIEFPYIPYSVQKDYMREVYKSCVTRQNALLESPTGTGKTLALLCSTLSWIKNEQEERKIETTKIFYTSRTHAQLCQVIKELEKTKFKPIVAHIGSRDQLCINPEVSKLNKNAKNTPCRLLVKSGKCPFHNNDKMPQFIKKIRADILDINELKKYGEANGVCPFYGIRSMVPDAGLVLMPYNYLLDPKTNKKMREQFKNSIIIIDEAHNVTNTIENITSFNISMNYLKKCLEEVKEYKALMQKKHEGNSKILKEIAQLNDEEINILLKPIENIIKYLESLDLKSGEFSYEGFELPSLFTNATKSENSNDPIKEDTYEINEINYHIYRTKASHAIKILVDNKKGFEKLTRFDKIIKEIFEGVFRDFHKSESYKVAIINDEFYKTDNKKLASASDKPQNNKKIAVYCLNPAIGFQKLIEYSPRNIILTSGTLSPLETLACELETEFPIRLENLHVIDKKQVLMLKVVKKNDGTDYCFNYESRKNPDQLNELSQLIMRTCQKTPGGILVFFSSYDMMWQAIKSIDLKEIHKYKSMHFIEDRNGDKNDKILENYKNASKKGAVLFAIFRGKISEGLDFADDAARAVIIVGIPFSPIHDKRVEFKRGYLDTKSKLVAQFKNYNGKAWYLADAIRAVNQAVGRLIRHIKDYGVIILVDSRYNSESNYKLLSRWLRESNCVENTSGGISRNLEEFFEYQKSQNLITNSQIIPEYKTSTILPQKIYPKSSIINPSEIAETLGKLNISKIPEESKSDHEIILGITELVGKDGFNEIQKIIEDAKNHKNWDLASENIFLSASRNFTHDFNSKSAYELLNFMKDLIKEKEEQTKFIKEFSEIISINFKN